LYHPDYRIILICSQIHSQNYRQSIHSLINKKDIHVNRQNNINDNKEDSLQGLYPYLWHNHSVKINLP